MSCGGGSQRLEINKRVQGRGAKQNRPDSPTCRAFPEDVAASNMIISFLSQQTDSVENSSGYSIPDGYPCTLSKLYYVQTRFDRLLF